MILVPHFPKKGEFERAIVNGEYIVAYADNGSLLPNGEYNYINRGTGRAWSSKIRVRNGQIIRIVKTVGKGSIT